MVIGTVTGVITAIAAIGSKKIYAYVKGRKTDTKEVKKESNKWQALFYDKLTHDDIAWG